MAARPANGAAGSVSAPPPERFAPHAVARWARDKPDAVAIEQAGAAAAPGAAPSRVPTRIIYGDLDRMARLWAGALARAGITAGAHVATLLPNGGDAQLAFLSLAWLRAVEVPVNPALRGTLLHHLLFSSDAQWLLTVEALLPQVRELGRLDDVLPKLRGIVVLDAHGARSPTDGGPAEIAGDAFFAGAGPMAAADLAGPAYRDIAAILYTSGTTGPSKGVLMTWSILSQNWSGAPDDMLPEGGSMYCALPLIHNSGRSCLNHTLARGGRFVWRERFSGGEFWQDVRRHGCGSAALVGPMVQYLHAQPERSGDADNPLSAIFCGPLIADIEAFKRRFGVRVATGYGMTEIGMVIVTDWELGPWQSCGRIRTSYPNPELRVVNDHDEPLGPGQVGELLVRTPHPWALTPGYYGMPDKSAEAWRNGWFHTGDLVRYDEQGWFYLVDRLKDSIRRRGENISSYEVESVISRYPGVTECAAVAVPAQYGEDEILVALQTEQHSGFDYAAFFAWAARELPRFMQPRYAEAMAALPRNETTQRVKKYALRERGLSAATRDREVVAAKRDGEQPLGSPQSTA